MGLSKKQLAILAAVMFVTFDVGAYFFIQNTIVNHASRILSAYEDSRSDIDISYADLSSSPLTKSLSMEFPSITATSANTGSATQLSAREVTFKKFAKGDDGPLTAQQLEAEQVALGLPGAEPLLMADSIIIENPVWAASGDALLQSFDKLVIVGFRAANGQELGDRDMGPWSAKDAQSTATISPPNGADLIIPADIIRQLALTVPGFSSQQ